LVNAAKKVGNHLFGVRGRLTRAPQCQKAITLIAEAHPAGAILAAACSEIGTTLRTIKRWRQCQLGDGDGEDRRQVSRRYVSHRLAAEDR
jgi:putative transposase